MKKFLQRQVFPWFLGIGLVFLLAGLQPRASVQATPPPHAAVNTQLSADPATLPDLPYNYAALEPHIDAQTMELHHSRHHAAFVNNLNEALKNYPNLRTQSVEALLQDLNSLPEAIRTTVRNNGGGHLNHSLFWQMMSPEGGGEATGALGAEIRKTFGSFEAFRQQFNQAGQRVFGSGWVWLVGNSQGKLQIITTPNQDSPVMQGAYPLLGNDVWEHAYYLKYQNRRPEYFSNWWNVVNWPEANRRYVQWRVPRGSQPKP